MAQKGFKKGDSNINRDGRPKGSANKISTETRSLIAQFVEGKWPELKLSFDKLDDKTKWRVIIDLLPYFVPKMSAIEMTTDFENLSQEQLLFIANNLIYRENEKDQ